MNQYEQSEGVQADAVTTSQQSERQQAVVFPTPFAGQQTFPLTLPIPAPNLYWDNYYHAHFPNVLPRIVSYGFVDPAAEPLAYPQPVGQLPAHLYNVLGATLHDFGYVNNHPEKLFTKYMLWFIEVNDHFFRLICPSDLNDTPCEWDELQGGCPMLRMCQMKHKYPHPHIGQTPMCLPENQQFCRFIHNIMPNCRSIARQLREPAGGVVCEGIASGGGCQFGHDFESARAESVHRYWEHKEEARMRGSVGWVKRDVFGRKLLRPIRLVEEEEDGAET